MDWIKVAELTMEHIDLCRKHGIKDFSHDLYMNTLHLVLNGIIDKSYLEFFKI